MTMKFQFFSKFVITLWKLVRKSIIKISGEILFYASGKKSQLFEDKGLHQKSKNLTPSALITIHRNELIVLQLAQFSPWSDNFFPEWVHFRN